MNKLLDILVGSFEIVSVSLFFLTTVLFMVAMSMVFISIIWWLIKTTFL